MYSSAFLNCFAPPLHCNLIADDFKLVECIADEPRNQGHWTNWVKANWPMMKTWNCQMSVDAERMKLMKAPKEMESKEHLLAHLELPHTMPWKARTHGEK